MFMAYAIYNLIIRYFQEKSRWFLAYAINYLAYARDYAILCEESRVEGRVFTLVLQMAAGITDKMWITLPGLSVI